MYYPTNLISEARRGSEFVKGFGGDRGLELLGSAAHKVELVVGRQQCQKRVMPNRNQTIVISSHIPDGIHFPINPGALHEHVEYLLTPTSEYQFVRVRL